MSNGSQSCETDSIAKITDNLAVALCLPQAEEKAILNHTCILPWKMVSAHELGLILQEWRQQSQSWDSSNILQTGKIRAIPSQQGAEGQGKQSQQGAQLPLLPLHTSINSSESVALNLLPLLRSAKAKMLWVLPHSAQTNTRGSPPVRLHPLFHRKSQKETLYRWVVRRYFRGRYLEQGNLFLPLPQLQCDWWVDAEKTVVFPQDP